MSAVVPLCADRLPRRLPNGRMTVAYVTFFRRMIDAPAARRDLWRHHLARWIANAEARVLNPREPLSRRQEAWEALGPLRARRAVLATLLEA